MRQLARQARPAVSLACLALLGVSLPPAQAAVVPPLTSTLIVSADKSSSQIVNLARTLTMPDFLVPASQFRISGRAFGYALLPLDRGPDGPFLMVVRRTQEPGAFVHGHGKYPPGRYRLVLMSEGPGTVQVSLPGQPRGTTRLHPIQPHTTYRDYRSQTGGSTGLGDGEASLFATRSVDQRTLVFITHRTESSVQVTSLGYFCWYQGRRAEPFLPACRGGGGLGVGTPVNVRQDHVAEGFSWGSFEPGTWTLRMETHIAGRLKSAAAQFVWLAA